MVAVNADMNVEDLKIVHQKDGLILGITRDEMEAYAVFQSEQSESSPEESSHSALPFSSFEEIRKLLEEHQIVYGLDEEAISSFLKNPPVDTPVLLASGKLPLDGQDAQIEYVYDKKEGPSPKQLEGGKVDLKDLNLNINVKKGDVLAQKTPPTPAEPGMKVTGEEIPGKEGRDKDFFVGKNTVVSEDGLQLLADMDGTISSAGSRLSVVENFTIRGDVDYSTGNIDFVGSVDIMGNILAGFKVKAQNDIQVAGVVEGAEMFAGGNVIIRRGIQGAEKAVIEANGSIEAKFVNGATLRAGEIIHISGPVMHSYVSAGDKIELIGKNGIGTGGEFYAGQGVELEQLGSDVGTATYVEVGLDPKMAARLQQIDEELESVEENLRKLEQAISTLNTMKEKQGSLPPEREKMLLGSIKTRYSLMGQVKKLRREQEGIQNQLNKSKGGGYIQVRGTVFPGVTIRIGKPILKVDRQLKHVTFRRQKGEIVTS